MDHEGIMLGIRLEENPGEIRRQQILGETFGPDNRRAAVGGIGVALGVAAVGVDDRSTLRSSIARDHQIHPDIMDQDHNLAAEPAGLCHQGANRSDGNMQIRHERSPEIQ
jgi:hypothetical protein